MGLSDSAEQTSIRIGYRALADDPRILQLSASIYPKTLFASISCVRESITHQPSHYYNYTANILINVTGNPTGATYHLQLGFKFPMSGSKHNEYWFHTDGLLLFNSKNLTTLTKIPGNHVITLGLEWFYGESLVLRSTSDNFTIDYVAKSIEGEQAHWIAAYYNNSKDWVFDVDTIED